MQLLAFETYRDLVKLLQQNLTEEHGLIAAELRNIEVRESARSAAAAAVGIQPAQPGGFASLSAMPAGKTILFRAHGFCNFAKPPCLLLCTSGSLTGHLHGHAMHCTCILCGQAVAWCYLDIA